MKSLLISLREWLFELPRPQKRFISVAADLCFICLALWVSFALRFEQSDWLPSQRQWLAFGTTALATIIVFVRIGLYRAVIRYISEKVLMVMVTGVVASAIALVLAGYLFQAMVPRSVPVIYASLLFVMVAGTRFSIRDLINRPREKAKGRVLIVGTGPKAIQLHYALMQGTEYRPMGFVSLDCRKHKSLIAGLQVYSVEHLKRAAREQGVQRVFLALEDEGTISRRDLIGKLEELVIPVQTVPAMSELMAGQARINDIRDLDIADLLGRDPVLPNKAVVAESLTGKVVMVTGAGGSIGSELGRQIIRNGPAAIVLLEQSEFALYSIERELRSISDIEGVTIEIHPLLGSVVHRKRNEVIMRSFGVDIVYHAAAYKHVPLVESNIIEGIQNNVMGTWHCAEGAIAAGVERFVLISTDKAVRPTNVMGGSKRLAELVLQGLALRQKSTRFSIVRFGNVLGSSGSVVPLFRDQIRDGGPVTVTHPEIIRYFMTIPEASQLVLQAGAMGEGGEVFVLDMGEPVKIADLARKMIRLMGLTEKTEDNPHGDVAITFTGLRPGEKLFEELLIGDEQLKTAHPRIMMAREESLSWSGVEKLLTRLEKSCKRFDCEAVVDLIREAPTGYSAAQTPKDTLWQRGQVPLEVVSLADSDSSKVHRLPL
ncbi:nucleoside-diphosphate sugar epimerase/dehydratase [Marinobacter sp. M216]|uniref:Nucleoside-diphosphate sugar epimerase/dehydratase n=1 Tax=Marinobacter albus TaxID=3030833 RepID=A0ABT7HA84_9GAMM|nr:MULTISPECIES: nucleoside-diphosphate sugar epimerase/dehydratase [unclassified Marinobacter]MBW7470484.1 polysaccharide biosynthesis protein [Marinobacter sp. F4218]MDK9557248.1 nucleoside-diphosphate sugar epimerase/dehydratase [Marinobacter sp. M216]